MNTQLTSAIGFNTNNVKFGKININKIPNSPLTYKRIDIQVKNPDGTMGELIIPTERVFSFGFQENKGLDGETVNGYVLPMCLWNKDGATPEEKNWSDTFNAIVDKCKEYIIENKDKLEQYELELSDLKKLNPLYYKREKGKIVEGAGPTLYAKLIISRKHDKIMTMVFDETTQQPIDPLEILGKYCFTKAAIKFESIFIGNKISLQVKVYEAEVGLLDGGMRRLLGGSKLSTTSIVKHTTQYSDNSEEEVQEESPVEQEASEDEIVDENVDETPSPESPPKKKGRRTKK